MHKVLQNKWPCIRHYIQETTLTDYMYQEKREEEDSASIEDSVDGSVQWLEDYIEKHEGGPITAIRNDTDNRMTITRKQKWEEEQLYGRFKRLISNTSHKKTWMWLRKGNFKREKQNLF